MNEPRLNDSGERRTFPSGAQRDRGKLKPRPDLISPHAQMREGMIFALGAEKYDTRNWEKGMPISECLASAQRHIEQWKRGDTDEDHLAQARWNLGAIIHYEEEIKAGRMSPQIDDMPHYADWPIPWRNLTPEEAGKHDEYMTKVREAFADTKFAAGDETMVQIATEAGMPPPKCLPAPPSEPKSLPAPPTDEVSRPYDIADEDDGIDCEAPLAVLQRLSCIAYVAGPMRGYTHFNFPAFDRARDLGESLGWKVISPADLDRAEGLDPFDDPAKINEVGLNPTVAGLRSFAHRDLNALLSMEAENGDAIAMLPGWEKSKGASMEHATAVFLGLAILDATTFKPLEN